MVVTRTGVFLEDDRLEVAVKNGRYELALTREQERVGEVVECRPEFLDGRKEFLGRQPISPAAVAGMYWEL